MLWLYNDVHRNWSKSSSPTESVRDDCFLQANPEVIASPWFHTTKVSQSGSQPNSMENMHRQYFWGKQSAVHPSTQSRLTWTWIGSSQSIFKIKHPPRQLGIYSTTKSEILTIYTLETDTWWYNLPVSPNIWEECVQMPLCVDPDFTEWAKHTFVLVWEFGALGVTSRGSHSRTFNLLRWGKPRGLGQHYHTYKSIDRAKVTQQKSKVLVMTWPYFVHRGFHDKPNQFIFLSFLKLIYILQASNSRLLLRAQSE